MTFTALVKINFVKCFYDTCTKVPGLGIIFSHEIFGYIYVVQRGETSRNTLSVHFSPPRNDRVYSTDASCPSPPPSEKSCTKPCYYMQLEVHSLYNSVYGTFTIYSYPLFLICSCNWWIVSSESWSEAYHWRISTRTPLKVCARHQCLWLVPMEQQYLQCTRHQWVKFFEGMDPACLHVHGEPAQWPTV